mmetsp:Transcript_35185/g.35827  ORF Transcript_35185/g.35827 Transcript_35185/m.35827 type:complete len:1262 (+) Transcript_35185:57-3842(+)
MSSIIYKFKWLINIVMFMMDCIMYFTGAGGFVYWIAESYYAFTFEYLLRQKSRNCTAKANPWENPRVVGKNRRPPHTVLNSFKSFSESIANYRKDTGGSSVYTSENLYYLTGDAGDAGNSNSWDFKLVGSPEQSPPEWNSRDFESKNWDQIKLPAHWQLQGYDIPIYTNTSYPFRFDPPRVARDGTWSAAFCDIYSGGTKVNHGSLSPKELGPNTTGLYRRHFSLPSAWDVKSDRVFIVLEGVDSCVEIWINEEFIGYSQDSCLSAEFEITSSLSKVTSSDTHVLAIRVMRWCDGSYLEDQDKWWLSGVYREVYLMKKPPRMIFDYEITTDLSWNKDEECVSAKFNVDVLVEGEVNGFQEHWSTTGGTVRMEIWAPGKSAEAAAVLTKELVKAAALPGRAKVDEIINPYESDIDVTPLVNPAVASFEYVLQKPILWTAETPHLYYCIISLHKNFNDAKIRRESAVDIEGCLVGVREVGIYGIDNSLCVNHVPIVINGVNRHEFDSFSGRAVSKKTMCHDMTLMKKMNFNSCRNSHYPPHPYWHELCNTAGLYVCDEANIETHGFQTFGQPLGYLAQQKEWKGAYLNRVVRMFERDKNNPSIILWSLGNEAGVGAAHYEMYKWLKKRDTRRLVQYESGGSDTDVTDIICPMYRRPMWCVEQARHDVKQRPVILCEYAHMMGNSGGSLDRYWQNFRDPLLPRMQGGFIWDFIDQGLNLPDGGFGYGGDFGDIPNTKQFCINGLFGPDRMPHPSAHEAAILQSPVALNIEMDPSSRDLWVTIKNLKQFQDLSGVKIEISLRCDAQPVGAFSASVTFDCGSIRPFTIGRRALQEIFPTMNAGAATLTLSTGLTVEVVETVREVWVELAAVMLGGDKWLSKGHDLVRRCMQHQIITTALLSNLSRPPPSNKRLASLKIDKNGEEYQIAWSGGTFTGQAVVGATCGRLLSWSVRNAYQQTIELLTGPVDVCLWRASTDNDRGGDAFSYHSRWEAVGLPNMQRLGVANVSVVLNENPSNSRFPPSQRVLGSLQCSWTLISPEDYLVRLRVPCKTRYDFLANGSISVSQTVHPPYDMPPLPRVGARCAVPSSFTHVEWLGLGPHEAYDDRKTCVRLGRFASQVDELHTPYVVPQECGRRADPRWVTLREGATGVGLMMLPAVMQVDENNRVKGIDAKGWGFSASRYTTEMLHKTLHEHELVPDSQSIDVHLDSKMMGLGGYDSWTPNVDHDYLIETGVSYHTNFILVPIFEQDDLHEMYFNHISCKIEV